MPRPSRFSRSEKRVALVGATPFAMVSCWVMTARDLTRLGRRRAAEADQAAVGEARRADILEEEAVRSAVAAVRRAGRVGIDDEEVVVVQQIGTGVGENRRLVRELAVDGDIAA